MVDSPLTLELWLRQHLFKNWGYGILSLVLIGLLLAGLGQVAYWALTLAHWQVIGLNLRLFFAGRYPVEQLWRLWFCLGWILVIGGLGRGIFSSPSSLPRIVSTMGWCLLGGGLMAFPLGFQTLALLAMLILGAGGSYVLGQKIQRHWQPSPLLLLPVSLLSLFLILWLLQGGWGLARVPLDDLSGLVLTLLTAVVSIALSFPLGVFLALGRQSPWPLIRLLAILYIEIIRALPLIGILFLAQVMLPLVLPPGWRPDRVVRAIAGFTIFSAAYLAENVRGGLQSIPPGQREAAQALGFNEGLTLVLIILPQALRTAIPALMGQFISLFKDTSLLAIAGLVDLLGMAQSILANPKFAGDYAEVYLFIALIYGLCSYGLAQGSRSWESLPS